MQKLKATTKRVKKATKKSRFGLALTLGIIALIVLPATLLLSMQEQNSSTHAASNSYITGYTKVTGGYDSGNNKMISASKVVTGNNTGTLQSISIYLKSVAAVPANHIQVALYADNGTGAPSSLITASASQVAISNSWNLFTFPGAVVINPNTTYWLAFNVDSPNTQYGWSSTSGKSVYHFNTPFGTWPATFGAVNTTAKQTYGIYMTYASISPSFDPTAVPSGFPSPTPTSVVPTNLPTPTPAPTNSGWPGPGNTGVPTGTVLTTYTGPCSITIPNTVIDAKIVNCSLDLQAAGIIIKNSKVNGQVTLDTDLTGSNQWSFTLQDSEVDGGPYQLAAVSTGNMTVLRSNIHGGQTAVQCEEKSVSCKIQDSWLHGQYIPPNGNWHLGGFLSDGGSNMQLIHNYVVCDHAATPQGEGCTGDINLIPNFATISHVLIQNNFLGANVGSAFCTYGGEKSTSSYPHANNVTYKDNVFQRGSNNLCAAYGPVTDFNVSGIGNQWINNNWEDGAPVQPAN